MFVHLYSADTKNNKGNKARLCASLVLQRGTSSTCYVTKTIFLEIVIFRKYIFYAP